VSTTRLIAFADEHVAPFAETIRDPAILQYTGTPVPTPEGWIEAWRQRFRDEDRANFAIVDDTGGFVGYAVTGPIDRLARPPSSATRSRPGRAAAVTRPRRSGCSPTGRSTTASSARPC